NLGNSQDGVTFTNGASSNTIGGAAGNTITFNGKDGVQVDASNQDLISGNSIMANAHLGIELTNGGNRNQPAPVPTNTTARAGLTRVTGTLAASPNTTYVLQFFADAPPLGVPAQGKTLLGSDSVTTGADGHADFIAVLASSVPSGEVITATATSPSRDT